MPDTPIQFEHTPCVGPGKAVHLRFWARNRESGELLQYGEDLKYLHGGFGGVFPKVERILDGGLRGEHRAVLLDPDEGYGRRDPELIIEQALEELPEEAHMPGSILFGELPDGREHPFTVISIAHDRAILDGNHPWAELPLEFTFEILDIREATAEECAIGYPLF